jgi:ribosomal-protein-serine acetyltransferase
VQTTPRRRPRPSTARETRTYGRKRLRSTSWVAHRRVCRQHVGVFSWQLDEDRHLRLLEEVDAAPLYQTIVENRESLSVWMPWAAGDTYESALTFIRSSRQQFAANLGFQAAIVERDVIVGVIGFSRVDWQHRQASIGYWIARGSQGRGTITLAARALLDHAFAVWQLNRVEIRAGTQNLRSRRVAERLGLTQEGVLREAERVGDRYVDHVVYAMLARDWPAARPTS